MQLREHALGCKVPVGDQSDEERRDHAGQARPYRKSRPVPCAREVEGLGQLGADSDVPGPPDDVVQKHHHAEAWADGNGHMGV